MKRSPILNRPHHKIIYLQHDPVETPTSESGGRAAAINVHTGSHHIYTGDTFGWSNVDDDAGFTRAIDEYVTGTIGYGASGPTLRQVLENHCRTVFKAMIRRDSNMLVHGDHL